MHPIQDTLLPHLDLTRDALTPTQAAAIEAALEAAASPAVFDAACVLIGLLEKRGAQGLARALAGVLAVVVGRAQARASARVDQRGAELRAFSGGSRVPAPKAARTAPTVRLSALFVPKVMFG